MKHIGTMLYIYILYIPSCKSLPSNRGARRGSSLLPDFAPMIEKPSGWGREEVQHHNLSKKGGGSGSATMLVLVFYVG